MSGLRGTLVLLCDIGRRIQLRPTPVTITTSCRTDLQLVSAAGEHRAAKSPHHELKGRNIHDVFNSLGVATARRRRIERLPARCREVQCAGLLFHCHGRPPTSRTGPESVSKVGHADLKTTEPGDWSLATSSRARLALRAVAEGVGLWRRGASQRPQSTRGFQQAAARRDSRRHDTSLGYLEARQPLSTTGLARP